jgi:hypothetical protein
MGSVFWVPSFLAILEHPEFLASIHFGGCALVLLPKQPPAWSWVHGSSSLGYTPFFEDFLALFDLLSPLFVRFEVILFTLGEYVSKLWHYLPNRT